MEANFFEKNKVMMKNSKINTPTVIFIDGGWLYAATRRINQKIDFAKFFNALINY